MMVTSFPGCLIAPAFIDLQIYGGNGKLFSHSLDTASLDATYAYCVSGGCSRFMITMATNSMENFFKGIETAGEYMASGKKGLLGLHLEGPWISPAKKGAHLEAFIKKPTRDEVMLLLEKGKGIVKMITLAPEQCDDEIIQLLLDHGIIVSAGHSNAAYSRAKQTFQMGIPAATHLFNAMSPLQGREPGMVGAIYDDPKVMSSIICDGVHVDFASVRISKKIMGERLFFITDAVINHPGRLLPAYFPGKPLYVAGRNPFRILHDHDFNLQECGSESRDPAGRIPENVFCLSGGFVKRSIPWKNPGWSVCEF